MDLVFFAQDVINGVLMGLIYGLVALGLTLIFGVLKVINFAHGSFLMVGMYVSYWTVTFSGLHPVSGPDHHCSGNVFLWLLDTAPAHPAHIHR